MTKYGREILDIVNHCDDHPTAEDIFLRLKERCNKVVLATVYNNLNSLCAQGEIRRVTVEGSPDRYDNTTPHDHLICKCCGAIKDMKFTDLSEQLEQQLGFPIESYDLKITYVCPHCRNKQQVGA